MTNKQRKVQRAILRWYSHHGRRLPWRGIRNPYRILVSEIMLQQTQVSRVLALYPAFIRRFPSFQAVASARQRDVVQAWRGMGYNNRAVRLHKLARQVVSEYRGKLPSDKKTLLALPGIGKYTANALLSSVHGRVVPIVDVNVQRVLSRLLRRMDSTSAMLDANTSWKLAEQIIPRANAYSWNQALMDLGATLCTARNPKCGLCPVRVFCASHRSMAPARHQAKKGEPQFRGIPHRLYRGRVIEYLRNCNGTSPAQLGVVAAATVPGFTKRNAAWFMRIVKGLEKDGLVTITGGGSSLSACISLA